MIYSDLQQLDKSLNNTSINIALISTKNSFLGSNVDFFVSNCYNSL